VSRVAPSRDRTGLRYPGPRAAAIIERMRLVEGAGLRTGGDPAPLVVESASGSTLIDPDGNRFVDLYASFAAANLGHAHPEVTAAIVEQAGRLTHASSAFVTELRVAFQEDLLALAPPGLDRVLLGMSGADANDLALKLARTLTGRREVIAFSGGYFGRSSGVVGLNGKVAYRQRVGRDPEAHFFPYPAPYRWRHGPPDAAGDLVLSLLDEAMSSDASGIGPIAAIMVEPIQGNGGVVIPPDGFLDGLRELADRHGALLVFDEIQSGFGRTGRLWAGEHWGVVPDLMTVGKGIGGGLAVSAVLGRTSAMSHWKPGSHTSTFLANALNLAAGRAALGVMRRERLWERSATLGRELLERLHADLRGLSHIGEIRGRGLFVGIEIVTDHDSRAPDALGARRVQERLFRDGVVVGLGGAAESVIKLSPPLTIETSDLWPAIDIVIDGLRADEVGRA
jgi:4-aminobutyrate aminotransferase-like enzyme